ncbi:MAG: glycosyltransferase [Candidatus Kapabacteria bacterium]|nr:glycosyltransferase [Candidatus Kapabacteria bacterium]MDW8011448.1 glycosyltransferase family 2 protein [Bacteroidota bacterium]
MGNGAVAKVLRTKAPQTAHSSSTPFFSVILCTRNRAHLLLRALRSLLRQQWQHWEALIIDDGGTDVTPFLVALLAQEDPRFRFYRTAHRGPGAARHYGILRARGEFITFLDSDDEYHPAHLSLRAEYLQQHPQVDFLLGGVEVIGPPFVPDRNDPRRWIHISECAVGGTFVVRRTLALEIGYPQLRFADDAAFYQKACAAGARIDRVNFPTYRYYRTTPDSLCTRHGMSFTAE